MQKTGFFKKNLTLLLILMVIFNPIRVFAQENSLNNIDIFVEIQDDGSARIKELREVYLVEGSENYIVIGNLGDSDILDFMVKENGKKYEPQTYWDISLSRSEKTYKSGVVETSDGYELCWGIGDYGRHLYEVEYTVTNFVKQFQDKQGIFWRFINDQTNMPPEAASLSIKSNIAFDENNSGIWAFGYEGEIVFENGEIIARSSKAFDYNNYMTILVELDDGMFNTSSALIDQPFEEIKKRAFEGSDYIFDDDFDNNQDNDLDHENDWNFNQGFNSRGFFKFFWFIPIFTTFILIVTSLFKINKSKSSLSGSYKNKYKGEYYRDYPYDGPLEDLYYLLNSIGTSNRESLITAFILKWLYNGVLETIKQDKGLIFKKEDTSLKFVNHNVPMSNIEKELYNMMLSATGDNYILEKNEFSKWARKNYEKVESWEDDAKIYSKNILKTQGYLNSEEKKILFFKWEHLVPSRNGEILIENIYKFKNYLLDYSLLNEHESINVGIWDYLMIWAGILGITDKVTKEFSKLYPNYEVDSVYRGNAIYVAYIFSKSASQATDSAARSSGGGGFSSSGGGGGSFGGGSGGGTR